MEVSIRSVVHALPQSRQPRMSIRSMYSSGITSATNTASRTFQGKNERRSASRRPNKSLVCFRCARTEVVGKPWEDSLFCRHSYDETPRRPDRHQNALENAHVAVQKLILPSASRLGLNNAIRCLVRALPVRRLACSFKVKDRIRHCFCTDRKIPVGSKCLHALV